MTTVSSGDRTVKFALAYGVLIGLVMAGIIVGSFLVGLQRRGVQVSFDTASVARQVEAEVAQLVHQQLPGTLSSLKEQIPAQVAVETGRRLAQTSFHVGGMSVPIPPAAIGQVQGVMEEAVRSGIELATQSVNWSAVGDDIARRASASVKERLDRVIGGQRLKVRLFPWFEIPVTLVPR